MLIALKPDNEKERVKALQGLKILDTPINPIFERITRLTKAMFNVPIVAISIIDSERQWFKSTQGLNVCQNDLHSSFCSHAILQNEVFVIPDAKSDIRFVDNPCVTNDPHVRFYAGCPIHTEDGYNIGTLCIIDKESRELSKEQITQLKDMAGLVQDELQKYREKYQQSKIIEELDQAKRAKLIDGLTGVWNREGSQININEQIILAHVGFVAGILDIDNFKKVNDTFGHNAGDDTIREVCKRVVIALDDQDIVGRWGGEEFIIIAKCEGNNLSAALNRIEAARASVAATPISAGDQNIAITITIGLTIFDPKMQINSEQLIAQADAALYEGKNSGKNKCVLHEFAK